MQEIKALGELFFRHFQSNTISPEESEGEKHKCVDMNTGQGVPINNPGVLIHYINIEKSNSRAVHSVRVQCFFRIAKSLSLGTFFL